MLPGRWLADLLLLVGRKKIELLFSAAISTMRRTEGRGRGVVLVILAVACFVDRTNKIIKNGFLSVLSLHS